MTSKCRAGGKIVWLTDREIFLYNIKYPRKYFELVEGTDVFSVYGKYMHQTVD